MSASQVIPKLNTILGIAEEALILLISSEAVDDGRLLAGGIYLTKEARPDTRRTETAARDQTIELRVPDG